jgi:single-stranded DNA-binding protein
MMTASLAVDVARAGEDADTEWFSIAAFNKPAEELGRHRKGDVISAIGLLHRSHFTGRDGARRSSWSLTVEGIVSARSVRPRSDGQPAHRRQGQRRAAPDHSAPLPDDCIDDIGCP